MKADTLIRRGSSVLACTLWLSGGAAATDIPSGGPGKNGNSISTRTASKSTEAAPEMLSTFVLEHREVPGHPSGPVRTLIADPRRYIRDRVNAVHNLGDNLDGREIAGLYAFLKAQPGMEKSLGGLHYLKNEIFTALRSQNIAPIGLTEVMIEISRDTAQDLATRDYALQHLALWCDEGARDEPGAVRRIRYTLIQLAEQRNTLAGTALLGLHRLTNVKGTREGKEVCNLALNMAEANDMPPAARLTAIAICGERGLVEALPTIEAVAQDAGPVGLRISAIGALGRLGGPSQIALLQRLESSEKDSAVRSVIAMALRRPAPVVASREPF